MQFSAIFNFCTDFCIIFPIQTSFLCEFLATAIFAMHFSELFRNGNFPQNQQSKETMRWFVVIFFQSHTNYFQNWIFTPSAEKLLLFLIFTEFTLSRVRWHGWAPQQQTLLGLAKDCLCWCIRDVDDDELLLQFAISTKFKHHSVLPVAIRFFTLFFVTNCMQLYYFSTWNQLPFGHFLDN